MDDSVVISGRKMGLRGRIDRMEQDKIMDAKDVSRSALKRFEIRH